jgi:hypothetical protein
MHRHANSIFNMIMLELLKLWMTNKKVTLRNGVAQHHKLLLSGG